MKKQLTRIEKEEQVVMLMIDLYYRKHSKEKENCPECVDLKQYVKLRLSKCPFQNNKTFCSNCKIHCYMPEYREKIRKVMRWSGPRMIFHHPIIAIKHVKESLKEKKRNESKQKRAETSKK